MDLNVYMNIYFYFVAVLEEPLPAWSKSCLKILIHNVSEKSFDQKKFHLYMFNEFDYQEIVVFYLVWYTFLYKLEF